MYSVAEWAEYELGNGGEREAWFGRLKNPWVAIIMIIVEFLLKKNETWLSGFPSAFSLVVRVH